MAYKDPLDKKLNKRMKQLAFFRKMGLEPRNINDPMSPLLCDTCGRESHRSTPHRFRHEKDCAMRDTTLHLLNITENDLVWSRKPRKHPVQLQMNI